ncbi:MAG: Endonuclease MutS2 [Bacteroidia bacterium]|nr:Endonuclease MutS2 [Bacteroidia bacterium]
MKFSIGDKVSFLNEPGGGTITAFKGRAIAIVRMDDGLEIPFPVEQLVPKSRQNEKFNEAAKKIELPKIEPDIFLNEVKKIPVEKIIREKENTLPKKISKARTPIEDEVDLHIENLLPSHRGMSNAEIIDVQLRHFTKALDNAIRNNYYKIVFIHGVGKGRLREEIVAILKTYSGVTFRYASYEKYGWGATEVLLK